ncbi:uncharacterized protein IWZ02DRAFT_265230 [Phyllosticta citriasiana]|uniref:Uncharacterized protein n=1 Tax=Phyllosticta citriasiana TaxID=595635 RepID=A0ABR1KV95_9PEZI
MKMGESYVQAGRPGARRIQGPRRRQPALMLGCNTKVRGRGRREGASNCRQNGTNGARGDARREAGARSIATDGRRENINRAFEVRRGPCCVELWRLARGRACTSVLAWVSMRMPPHFLPPFPCSSCALGSGAVRDGSPRSRGLNLFVCHCTVALSVAAKTPCALTLRLQLPVLSISDTSVHGPGSRKCTCPIDLCTTPSRPSSMRLACPIALGLCNCHRHFPSTLGQHPIHRRNECQSKARMAKSLRVCTRACENATVPRVPLRLPHTPSILDTPHYTASTHEYPHQPAGTYYVPNLSTNNKYPYTTSRNWAKHRFSMHKPSVGERKAVS